MTRARKIENLLVVIREAGGSEWRDESSGWRFPPLKEWERIKRLALALESVAPKRKAGR